MSNQQYILFYLFLPVLSACTPTNPSFLTITESEYEDKMKAAWIGQMVGVGRAAETEYKWIGDIIPEDRIPEWDNDMVNQYNQDDLYVEVNFMSAMEKFGINVPIRSAGIHFANSEFGLAGANGRARENLRAGIAPPASGHPRFNINCDDIDYQIEADFSGIIAPAMFQVPIDMANKFGRLVNYGDGIYAGQFIGGMYAAAYFEKDIKKIIHKGLDCIPDSSLYAVCIRDVISWHGEDSIHWQNTWKKITDKYYRTLDHQPFYKKTPKAWAGIDAKLNGAFVVMGLLYGRGDIDSTFYIATRAGFDSDCNPSSALGVLFTSMGLSNIPEKYYTALDTTKCFAGADYTFPKIIELSKGFMKSFLLQQGGKIKTGNNGQEQYLIPVKPPVLSGLERSWLPDDPDEASIRFTEMEMNEMLFLPSSAFDKILQDFAPGWLITNAAAKAVPELISLRQRNKVLQMAFTANGQCNLRHELIVPEKEHPELKVSLFNEPGKTWTLKILFNWQPVYTVEVNDGLTAKGWYEVHCDMSAYKGKKLFILIQGSKGNGADSKVFLNDLSVR